MILQSTIETVNERTDIVEVIGQFVRLKRRGTNYIANCPFHNERSPSFNVNPARGIFKCFGCGKAGNAITFLQEHEKLNYPESIKWLADFYKIEFEETERTAEQVEQQQNIEGLRIVAEFAATWFAETLHNTEEGQAVGLSYFKHRGFRKETLETFRCGYCPESGNAFYNAAVSKGYKVALLEELGLVKQRNGQFYDAYRGRVIFPIQNLTGRVIGFGARLLKSNDRAPKYVNSPENELYHKSKTLYGLYQARAAVGKLEECLLVEGYTDVVSLNQAGVENVVASSGTSLTEDQLGLIGRLTKNITILYDGDAAGVKAALRGLDMALESGFNVQLALLPDGADPDSFVQERGTGAFRDFIKEHKRDIIGFRLEAGLKEAGTDPVLRSKLANEIAASISRFTRPEDFTLRDHYLKTAAEGLGVDPEGLATLVNKQLRERLEAGDRNAPPPAAPVVTAPPAGNMGQPVPAAPTTAELALNAGEQQEWKLVSVLIEHGGVVIETEEGLTTAQLIEERVDPELIENKLARRMFELYYMQLAGGTAPDTSFFTNNPDSEISRMTAQLLQTNDVVSENWSAKFKIHIHQGAPVVPEDVESSLLYFELKKLKMMEAILLKRLQEATDPDVQLKIQTAWMELKMQEKEMLQASNTVIVKTGQSG